MFRLPFLPKPRYSFVLTPEGLELGSPDPAVPPIFEPLAAGVLGPEPTGDPSSCQINDPLALREAIKACLQRLGRPVRRAHVALDGLLVRTVTLPIPFVPPREELELAVRTEAERYRVFAGAEVACDFTMLASQENELSVLLAAARRDYVDGVVEAFESEGIRVESVEPAPFALLRGLVEAGAPVQDCGMVTVFPQQIHVSAWDGDALQSWRTLHVRAGLLAEGEAVAIAETAFDLQRTLLSVTRGAYVLVNAPDPLKAALPVPEGVALSTFEARPPEQGTLALRGALAYGPERGPFVFDLRLDRLKPVLPVVSKGVVLPLAFAGMLIAALGVNLWLTDQVKGHEAEVDRLQEEMAAMQATIAKPDGRQESEAALTEALVRSESVVALFQRFQDDTPHDVWLARTELGADERVLIEGYSLSRQGPLLLAQALGQSRSLTGVEVPEVAEADWQGEAVYRFKLQATFTPQGRFRP